MVVNSFIGLICSFLSQRNETKELKKPSWFPVLNSRYGGMKNRREIVYTSVPPSTKTKKVCRIVHTFFILSPLPGSRFFQNPGFALRGKTVCPAPEKAGCLSPDIHLFRPPRNKGITHWTLLSPHAEGCMGTPTSKSCAKGEPSRLPLETSHIPTTSFRGPKPEKTVVGIIFARRKTEIYSTGRKWKKRRKRWIFETKENRIIPI